MSTASTDKIDDTIEAWESGALGRDPAFVKRVSDEKANAIDETLGLQLISIRLDKDLIETFKHLAIYHGVGYQPLMRDALRRFASAEMKMVLAAAINQKAASTAQCDPVPAAKSQIRKAAKQPKLPKAA